MLGQPKLSRAKGSRSPRSSTPGDRLPETVSCRPGNKLALTETQEAKSSKSFPVVNMSCKIKNAACHVCTNRAETDKICIMRVSKPCATQSFDSFQTLTRVQKKQKRRCNGNLSLLSLVISLDEFASLTHCLHVYVIRLDFASCMQ